MVESPSIVPSMLRTMPLRPITTDEWRSSTVTERRLRDLEKEGLLHPLTTSM